MRSGAKSQDDSICIGDIGDVAPCRLQDGERSGVRDLPGTKLRRSEYKRTSRENYSLHAGEWLQKAAMWFSRGPHPKSSGRTVSKRVVLRQPFRQRPGRGVAAALSVPN